MKTLLASVGFSCFNLDIKDELAVIGSLNVKVSGVCLFSLDICFDQSVI